MLSESRSASLKSTPTLCAGGLRERRDLNPGLAPETASSRSDRKDVALEVEGFGASGEVGKTPNSELGIIGETPSYMAELAELESS